MDNVITSKILAGWCIFLMSFFGLQPQPASAATAVQFTLIKDYLIVVPVTINGGVSCDFLFDTGTNTTILQTEFAQQFGLRLIDRVELVTTAGSQIVPRAKLPKLSLEQKTVKDLEVLFSDLREVRKVLPTVRGILGQNFLSQFNFLVDYSKQRISFINEADALLSGAKVPFHLAEGKIILTTGLGWHLMLDSALPDLLLFDATKRISELSLPNEKSQAMHLKSNAGGLTVWQTRFRTIRLGGIKFQNLLVTLHPQKSSEQGRLEDGLLPMSLFQSIYVNHQHNFVILNPRPAAAAKRYTKD